jgi:hypothetical protein
METDTMQNICIIVMALAIIITNASLR